MLKCDAMMKQRRYTWFEYGPTKVLLIKRHCRTSRSRPRMFCCVDGQVDSSSGARSGEVGAGAAAPQTCTGWRALARQMGGHVAGVWRTAGGELDESRRSLQMRVLLATSGEILMRRMPCLHCLCSRASARYCRTPLCDICCQLRDMFLGSAFSWQLLCQHLVPGPTLPGRAFCAR